MASHESLPDGQRAILQLLLKQGKSYDDLAGLLKSDPAGVRRRAHEAVEALGPGGDDIDVDRRHEIADYLLGQQSASQRAATREYLEDSAAGRAWARSAAGGLGPLAGSLPDVPAEPPEVKRGAGALHGRTTRDEEERSSRAGGMLIFAGLGVVLAIGLLWAFGAFDGKETTAGGPTTSTATTETPIQYEPLQIAVIKPRKGSTSKASATTVIARRVGTQDLSLAIQALKLPASSRRGAAYGVWLYTSPTTAQFVGSPARLVGKDGALQAAFQLNKDTPAYKEVLLTRESRQKPSKPGTIVLRGPLQLVPPEARGQSQTQPEG